MTQKEIIDNVGMPAFFIFTFCVKHPFGFDGIRVLGGFFISSMDNETYSFDLSYRLYLFFQRNKLDLISKYAQPQGTTIIIMSTKRIRVNLLVYNTK